MLFGLAMVALAAISWGTTGATLQLVGATSTAVPLVVGATRMLVAAPLLAALTQVTGDSIRPSSPRFLLSGLCMAAYQVFYFSAVPRAGIAATALLAICSAPILVALLARVVLHEPLTPSRLIAMTLGIIGASLLIGAEPAGVSRSLFGGALALGAGLVYSLYAVTAKADLRNTTPLTQSALTFSVAALALLPIFAIQPGTSISTLARGWPLLLYLGAIPTAGAYWLYTSGLRRIPAGSAATAGLLEPLTATALGLLVFGEHFTGGQVIGAGLLLVGMGILAAATARMSAPAVPH